MRCAAHRFTQSTTDSPDDMIAYYWLMYQLNAPVKCRGQRIGRYAPYDVVRSWAERIRLKSWKGDHDRSDFHAEAT